MRKGTTPTFLFTMPFSADEVKNARVVFGYGHDVRLKKEGEECEISNNSVKVKLSQADTFLFDCNSKVEIQLRILHTDGNAYVSSPLTIFVEKCLDSEVIE